MNEKFKVGTLVPDKRTKSISKITEVRPGVGIEVDNIHVYAPDSHEIELWEPEEGDWVRFNNQALQVRKIHKYTDTSKIWFNQLGGLGAYLHEIEPWKPKEGEWCWFYGPGKHELGQFRELHMNGLYYTNDINAFEKCEPFIGELPSFIQNKVKKD
jgi:hypothetical protein